MSRRWSLVDWLALVVAILALALLTGCIGDQPRVPAPAPATDPAPVPPPVEERAPLPAEAKAVAQADRRIADLKGQLATAEADREALRRAATEAPLRALLTWALWAGGALALLGTLALGLTFSPWGSWIPGGKATALALIATGVGGLLLARSLVALLALAWLPWALLAGGLLALIGWLVVRALRLVADHGDRMERAWTYDSVHALRAEKQSSAAQQTAAGMRGLIQFARGRRKPIPKDA